MDVVVIIEGVQKVNDLLASGAFEILSQFQRGQLERLKTEFQADYLIRTTSGELRWIGDHSFPWHDGGGNVIGTVGILIDIHGRKHTEEMLRERLAPHASTIVHHALEYYWLLEYRLK